MPGTGASGSTRHEVPESRIPAPSEDFRFTFWVLGFGFRVSGFGLNARHARPFVGLFKSQTCEDVSTFGDKRP